MTRGRLILDPPRDAFRNMAADEALFESSRQTGFPATLRIYSWRPHAVSLGRRQKYSLVNAEARRKYGVDVVRRFGGGAAVYHGEEITYCFVRRLDGAPAPDGAMWRALFRDFLERVGLKADPRGAAGAEAIRQTSGSDSVAACFARAEADEPLLDGKKWVGNARRKSRNVFLQHGSVLLRRQPGFMKELVEGADDDASVGLKDIFPALDADMAIESLKKSFEGVFGLRMEEGCYTRRELETAGRLEDERRAEAARCLPAAGEPVRPRPASANPAGNP